VAEPLNEVTFVARLGAVTAVRASERREQGLPVLIESAGVEERQLDPVTNTWRRCDIRLNGAGGQKLASGEMKRPEVPEGRDVANEALIEDARNKAVARGLPYYVTCNMADIALFAVADRRGEPDREEARFQVAPIKSSSEVEANWERISKNWWAFLDELEERLAAVAARRPSVTTADVVALRDAIDEIADEAIDRVTQHLSADESLAEQVRDDAATAFGFAVALNSRGDRAAYRSELTQILRLGAFVVAQKLILHRVLSDAGPRRAPPFSLDDIPNVAGLTDPETVKQLLHRATDQAITRSGDYETAFNLQPLEEALFLDPPDVQECRVGEVWQRLIQTVSSVSWSAISQNLTGFLYEAITEPEFRHLLGQHYTPEDVVDLLVTFAIRDASDVALDPASGGGSFARSLYSRKTALGDTHDQALAEIWGFEIAVFAAELTTITLATADVHKPAAYPRVLLRDFFSVRPGESTELQIPGEPGTVQLPKTFDAVVGNPPYISYRRLTNQAVIEQALIDMAATFPLPDFSGKSDAYVWFIVHATRFLRAGGRLAFVVSAAILFADYGVPLIRFISRYFRIVAVVDSTVERWFVEADTNVVLLMLEREDDATARSENETRFVRLRRPLAKLLAPPDDPQRRDSVEDLVDQIITASEDEEDPRFLINLERQGDGGGIEYVADPENSSPLDDL
jgi:hypothetical protein